MAPHASRAQHAHNLPDILSTSWEEFKSRLRLEARNIASNPLNPRPDDVYLKEDEIEPFIEDQGKTLFNLSSALLEHLTTTRTPSPEMARRESLGYAGPREGFLLRPEYKLIDMIVDFRRKAKYIEIQALHNDTRNEGAIEVPARIGRSYNLTFPQISDLRRILKEAPPERYVHFRVLSRLTGLDITGEGRESLIEAQRTVELDSFSFIDQMHLERRSSLPQFGAYMKHLMMVHQDMTGFVRHYSDSLFLELPERPSLRGLFVGYDEQLRAWAGKALGDIGNQLRNRRLSSEERGTLEADLAKVKKSHQKIAARIGGWRTMTYELKLGALLPSEFFENKKGTVDITDHAIAKFIYVVRANGEIPVARESIGNDGTKVRPTHSQLARGEPVYGAGELIIGTHHERTSSLHVWHDLDHKLSTQPKDHTWKLFEANNASGHYLPPAAAFLGYAFNEMKHALDSQGIITQEVRLENRLMPGTEFSGPSFL
jgi:hypothetical protein